LIRVLNVNHAEIYTWDHAQQTLRLLARAQESSWRGGQEPVIRLSERPITRLALEGRRSVFVQVGQEVRLEDARLRQIGAKAALALPVLGADQVLGIVQAYYLQPPSGSLANEIISRAQRQMLESLAQLAGDSDMTRFSAALDDVKAALEADWIEFIEVDPKSGTLKLRCVVGSGVWSEEPRPQIDVTGLPDVREALELRRPLNYFQGEDDLPPGARSLFDATLCRSLLALPLIGRGQTLGLALFADTLHSRAFTSREVDLGRAIVGQAATALENVGLVRDLEASLSNLKDAQARLVQSARLSAMGELAAAIAHQINNPLTTIVLDTELLLELEPKNTQNYEVLSAVSRAGKRAAGVVRRLLAMARPISADAVRSEVSILDTIHDVASLVRPHIEREGIRLNVQLPSQRFPPVLAVPGELNDVWLNLILNAHDAVQGGKAPEIGVTANYDAGNASIEVHVWDNGPGIPSEIVGEIFKPFFTTKPPGEGTGLGLHICRQVVDRVGGAISVQTSASGTRFMVRLPIIRST
jgi:signal transduction histidine kinase